MSFRVNRVDDLPDNLREQARKKMGQTIAFAATCKYNNVRTEADGHIFDSQREAERYGELKLLYSAREIAALMIHVPFPLPGGITYLADFVYFDLGTQQFVVEDAKGCRTKEYIIKKKLMKEIGIGIQEV